MIRWYAIIVIIIYMYVYIYISPASCFLKGGDRTTDSQPATRDRQWCFLRWCWSRSLSGPLSLVDCRVQIPTNCDTHGQGNVHSPFFSLQDILVWFRFRPPDYNTAGLQGSYTIAKLLTISWRTFQSVLTDQESLHSLCMLLISLLKLVIYKILCHFNFRIFRF